MSKEYEQEINKRFPNLNYSEFRVVDNRQERLGIDDMSYCLGKKIPEISQIVDNFVLSCRGFVYFYTAGELSLKLNNKLDSILEKLDPERTILIFPGNGAQSVRAFIRPEVFEYFATLDMRMKRVLGSDMSVSRVNVLTGKNEIRKIVPRNILSFVLVDDVLLSGTTAQSSRKFIDEREEFDWYAAVWMALSPLQSRDRRQDDIYQSSLSGYLKVVTNVLYQGTNGIPANNSLSSFAENDDKAEAVITGYKKKYVEDQEMFDQVISELRRLKNE